MCQFPVPCQSHGNCHPELREVAGPCMVLVLGSTGVHSLMGGGGTGETGEGGAQKGAGGGETASGLLDLARMHFL